MSHYKVDYSELVTALQDHQSVDANKLLGQLVPGLRKYLMVVMDASFYDAEDAVQQALLKTCEKIMQDKIEDKKYIFKYLITACRNCYLHLIRNDERYMDKDINFSELMVTPQQQIRNLMNKPRQKALELCLQKLSKKSRTFITYLINHPNATTRGISERFSLTESNVRVKKSRIMEDLSNCVKKKLEG